MDGIGGRREQLSDLEKQKGYLYYTHKECLLWARYVHAHKPHWIPAIATSKYNELCDRWDG